MYLKFLIEFKKRWFYLLVNKHDDDYLMEEALNSNNFRDLCKIEQMFKNDPRWVWNLNTVFDNPNSSLQGNIKLYQKYAFKDNRQRFEKVFNRRYLTLQDVKNHPYYDWRYDILSENINLKSKIDKEIQANLDTETLSRNNSLDMNYVKKNKRKWDYYYLSSNPGITMQDVLKHPEKEWSFHALSSNPNISMRDVLNHPNKEWDYENLSGNPAICLEDVLNNPDKKWDFSELTTNLNFKIEDMLKHQELPWDWHLAVIRYDVTLKIFLKNQHLDWNWNDMSYNTNITTKDILKYCDQDWNFGAACEYCLVDIKDVVNNPRVFWSYTALSKNRNITPSDVLKYPLLWHYNILSENDFLTYGQKMQNKIENCAARIIQNAYKERIYNPKHPFIQNKLREAYEDYQDSL